MSLLVTMGAIRYLPSVVFFQVLSAIGIAHYVQAFFTTKTQFRQVFLDSFRSSRLLGAAMLLVLVFSFCVGVFAPNRAIVLLFGFHFVFSEVFLFRKLKSEVGKEVFFSTQNTRIVFSAYCYLCYTYIFMVESFMLLLSMYAVGVALWAWLVFQMHHLGKQKWNSELSDLLAFETLGLLIIPISRLTPIGYSAALFYHVISWLFIPLHLRFAGAVKIFFYQLLMTAAFFLLIPLLGFLPGVLAKHQTWLVVLGTFHIITTFFTSGFNPEAILLWNRKMFFAPSKK